MGSFRYGSTANWKTKRKAIRDWYTPVTGIWQTVWIEAVAPTYIQTVYSVPDIDQSSVKFFPKLQNANPDDQLQITILIRAKKSMRTVSGMTHLLISSLKTYAYGHPKLLCFMITH
jgi:hypothetical protein